MPAQEGDTLHRFLIENSNVRGEWVHLDASWRALLERGDYPEPVRSVLGEALAAVTLLSATIKFEGSLIFQVTGDGPLHMLVVEATGQRTVRGLAHWNDEVPHGDLGAKFGDGRIVMTIDPGPGRDRYQAITEVTGDSLADAIQSYFERSEQLPTRLWLATDRSKSAGLLLQSLPQETPDQDAWNRTLMLTETLSEQELLELPAEEVLYRLYHEEGVRMLSGEPVSFRCGCSQERVDRVIRGLGYQEAQDILQEQGAIDVDCEFCGAHYHLDAVDVEQLFAGTEQPPGSRRLQ